MFQEFQNQLVKMQGSGMDAALASRRPPSPFFGKGELFYPMGRKPVITKAGKLSKNSSGKGSADYLIETSLPNESFQPAYVKGMGLGVPTEIGSTAILKPDPALRVLENFNIYQKDWLRGYKPIRVPKSSTSTDVGSTTANIAEISALNKLRIGAIGAAEESSSMTARLNRLRGTVDADPIVDNVSATVGPRPTKIDEALYNSEKDKILLALTKYARKNYTPEAFKSGLPVEESMPEANRVLNNFLERIQTPEGQRRLEDLGISSKLAFKNHFKDLKLKTYRGLGEYTPSDNTIELSKQYTKGQASRTMRHELEHAVDEAVALGEYLKDELPYKLLYPEYR
jgi:hypothetical protein